MMKKLKAAVKKIVGRVNKRQAEVLSICSTCPMFTLTKQYEKKFYTCGPYRHHEDGKYCGCILSAKTVLRSVVEVIAGNKIPGLLQCPQKKW